MDVIGSLIGLVLMMPILVTFTLLVWMQDWHNPFYLAPRVSKGGEQFSMLKLRSMIYQADKTGVVSTALTDKRITSIGHIIRRYKLDELTQLWNVLIGDMSLVGPRPNLKRETNFYTAAERNLLSVRPGITDFSSIVFSDEGEILKDHLDPDIAYNQLIRPGKSELGLFYIENNTVWIDIRLCWLTVVAIFSRSTALHGLHKLLMQLGAEKAMLELVLRKSPLTPRPPPGSERVVTSRDGNTAI